MEDKSQLSLLPFNDTPSLFEDDPYVWDKEGRLWKAVQLAINLNKPLLVGGDPGVGKTQLAYAVARQLNKKYADKLDFGPPFLDEPLRFDTKSSSSAADLFYYYDAVSHFRDRQNRSVDQFIDLKALGVAFALSKGLSNVNLPPNLWYKLVSMFRNPETGEYTIDGNPRSSVVLVDEVDKAPREFPNDLLNEIERYNYFIRELNYDLKKGKESRVLIILTSNFEKNLPAAFLRRCVYYHIPFPKDTLLKIVEKRIKRIDSDFNGNLQKAVDKFIEMHNDNKSSSHIPSTAELLDWIGGLIQAGLLKADKNFPPHKESIDFQTYQLITDSLVLKTN